MGRACSIVNLGNSEASQRICVDEIDALVELNSPTLAHRMGILCMRPARVWIDYLGWPDSVCGRGVDYVIGDAYTIPAGEETSYPGQMIQIERVVHINDYAAKTLLLVPRCADVGLTDDVLVLATFEAINKVRDEVWTVWMHIAKVVPNAVL